MLTDRIDEWLVNHLFEYEKKQLVSVAKGKLDLGKLDDKPNEEEQKQQEESAKPLLDKIKTALGDKVKDVKITHRLVNSPSCLIVDDMSMSIHLERMLKQAGQAVPESKPTLEVNPAHALIKKMQGGLDEKSANDLALVIFEQATLAEGLQLEDPVGFVTRINQFIN